MKILAIIPARGGSKGIPRKNIRPLCGKPLIAWTIEQAIQSKLLNRVIVSTEDEEIAQISRQYGAEVPFLRPVEYAQDHSPSSEAVLHVLDTLEAQGDAYDIIVLLEPTSPLRKVNDIDTALSQFVNSGEFEALVSLGEVHMEHPMIVKKVIDGRLAPYMEVKQAIWQRQQVDKAYFPYGVIYAVKVAEYRQHKSFYLPNTMPYFIERWQNYEVDDLDDFLITELMLKQYLLGETV
jgi:CMP-N-acetylneuraminic acid synthetase